MNQIVSIDHYLLNVHQMIVPVVNIAEIKDFFKSNGLKLKSSKQRKKDMEFTQENHYPGKSNSVIIREKEEFWHNKTYLK